MVPGTLYIVATPLGNLEDMTFRAVRILKEADLIAAEDTRHSRKLLAHYGIQTPMISCHEHNEQARSPALIENLLAGKNVALITDAGTPCVSDPGYRLVKAVSEKELAVIPVPGCSAAIAGLSVAGLPSDAFLFLGFLPKKILARTRRLEGLKQEKATLIFYESPKRIPDLVGHLLEIFEDRRACLAREITKKHEEYIRGTLSHILDRLEHTKESLGRVKGECTLLVEGCPDLAVPSSPDLEGILRAELAAGARGTASLAKKISGEYRVPKNQVYDIILRIQASEPEK